MATPIWARFSAGASFTPSPVTATTCGGFGGNRILGGTGADTLAQAGRRPRRPPSRGANGWGICKPTRSQHTCEAQRAWHNGQSERLRQHQEQLVRLPPTSLRRCRFSTICSFCWGLVRANTISGCGGRVKGVSHRGIEMCLGVFGWPRSHFGTAHVSVGCGLWVSRGLSPGQLPAC
jgi:hypothetical protein